MNNNLVIFYHDGSKDAFSFPLDKSESEALKDLKMLRPDVQGEDIKKYFYITNDETPPDTYGNFYNLSDNLKLTMDLRAYAVREKAIEIKQKRDAFLKRLDLPFMLSLEEDDDTLKNHVKKLKEFLRDLPENLRFKDLKGPEDIIRYNPFGNIFDIEVIDSGSGYTFPPKVIIDSPRDNELGFTAEAIAFIKGGEVTRIETIENGCAYDYVPLVHIDPPEEGEPAIALCNPPQNIYVTQQDVMENTQRRYL